MKKVIAATLLVIFIMHHPHAQTKIFQEVGDEISSQVKTIRQDGALVGYLVFSNLEKVNEDSFNYKITIMDENLNDIGTVNFREQGLSLQDVAFEKDILCLAYIKSNVIGYTFKGKKEYRDAYSNMKNVVFMQFVNLEGKILNTSSFPVSMDVNVNPPSFSNRIPGILKHDIQLKNITQRGFVCFYGDKVKNAFLVFNTKGITLWQKTVDIEADNFYMLTSGRDIHLLAMHKPAVIGSIEGGYDLYSYTTHDTSFENSFPLRDEHGRALNVMAFDNDPVTGKPFLAGYIINQPTAFGMYSTKDPKAIQFPGVFTINVNGYTSSDLNAVYTFWSDVLKNDISAKQLFKDGAIYYGLSCAFRDFDGNTYFAGSNVIRQNKDATLSFENISSPEHTSFIKLFQSAKKTTDKVFYPVSNADTKTNYLIADDEKNIIIYNVTQKKVMRSIPHKEGSIRTNVYPAKEGHVMVAEYNKKEKFTKLSIEAL